MIWSVAALALGLIVVVVLALLCSPLAEQPDPAMVWEARVAVGFAAIGFVGPFWLAQGIVTLVATFTHGGVWAGWLWVWFAAAPLLGAAPPAAASARLVAGALRRRTPATYSSSGAAAVQQEANFAWAATQAGAGWEMRRTPPLPQSWPPTGGGPAVWICYAERVSTPQTIEVTAPWARVTLAAGESACPVLERLSDAIEPLGLQAVQPIELPSGPRPLKQVPLIDAVHGGDVDGRLERTLRQWRSHNGLIASHPAVAPHLPPG